MNELQTSEHRLGEPIALHDFLALPPGDERYDRDDEGRLTRMSPESAQGHRFPLGAVAELLIRALPRPWRVLPEPAIAFDPIGSLRGERLPESRHGLKTLAPDVGVFDRVPRVVAGQPAAPDPEYGVFTPDGLRVVVELLSPKTWRSDLGQGRADAVDRWRTFLDDGVDELWLLNATRKPLGLPPRSGLLLGRRTAGWTSLEGTALTLGEPIVHELRPALGGRVRSEVLGGFELDLDALWSELDQLGA